MTVAFALTGDIFPNSRAIRQIDALDNYGVKGLLLHFSSPDRPSIYRGFRAVTLPKPASGGPKFFLDSHRILSEALEKEKADVFHASDLYALPAMAKHASQSNAKLVFDSRELYHHVAGIQNKPHSKLFWHLIQAHFLPKCDLILTVSDSIADRLEEQYKITRPAVIPNVSQHPRPSSPRDIRSKCRIDKDAFVVLHQGHARLRRGCDLLVQALALLDPNIHVVFLGNDQTNGLLANLASDLKVEKRVHFLPPVPQNELLEWTASADIGTTLLEDSCLNHRFALPNKLFEYLAAGIPVIGTNLPEIAKIIDSFSVGAVTEYDAKGLATIIAAAHADPSILSKWKRNTDLVVSAYNWDRIRESFINAYSTVLS